MKADVEISELIGKTLTFIDISDDKEEIIFKCADGSEYLMMHYNDCCEQVYIEDICGDLNDLIGVPIVKAEEVVSESKYDKSGSESETWTFYKLAGKSDVTIRWLGRSNGYYSEEVDFVRVKNPKFEELLK